jgi:LmbE family N-acetylglucosaminyl deacetylase
MKVLVIAPHPDDEVMGCGGTIVKHVYDNDIVYLCIVTTTYEPDWSKEFAEKRKKEIKRVNGILGIKKTYPLNFPTVKLDTIPQKELNDSITKIVRSVNPDILYIPHQGDLNKDHRLVFDSALVSIRFNNEIKKVMSYEVPSSTEFGRMHKPFIPNIYVDITKSIFEKKN